LLKNVLYWAPPGRGRSSSRRVRLTFKWKIHIKFIMEDGDWENRLLWKLKTENSQRDKEEERRRIRRWWW
jgi:hypothetical protein